MIWTKQQYTQPRILLMYTYMFTRSNCTLCVHIELGYNAVELLFALTLRLNKSVVDSIPHCNL